MLVLLLFSCIEEPSLPPARLQSRPVVRLVQYNGLEGYISKPNSPSTPVVRLYTTDSPISEMLHCFQNTVSDTEISFLTLQSNTELGIAYLEKMTKSTVDHMQLVCR